MLKRKTIRPLKPLKKRSFVKKPKRRKIPPPGRGPMKPLKPPINK